MPKFKPGRSGNPKGKPKGTKNRMPVLAQELLDNEAEIIVRKLIDLAKNGNLKALQLCTERILPPLRERLFR